LTGSDIQIPVYKTNSERVVKHKLRTKENYIISPPAWSGSGPAPSLEFKTKRTNVRGKFAKDNLGSQEVIKLPRECSQTLYKLIKISLAIGRLKVEDVNKHLIAYDDQSDSVSTRECSLTRRGPLVQARLDYYKSFKNQTGNGVKPGDYAKAYRSRNMGKSIVCVSNRALNKLLWGHLYLDPLIHLLRLQGTSILSR
jgi:hypothetical protein